MVYVLAILEFCGMSRSYLIEKLKNSIKFQTFFGDETVDQFLASV
jgi:hypothetical protein